MTGALLISLKEVRASFLGTSLSLEYPFIEGRWGFLISKLAVDIERYNQMLICKLSILVKISTFL